MESKAITLPPFHVVGYKIEADIKEFESGLGKSIYHSLFERKDEIQNKKNENVILMQVSKQGDVPLDIIGHAVGESKYVTYTDQGLESELSRSYDYIYGQWIRETGNEPKDYDFEIWDERYKPESLENEIDLFVALK
ncbi:AraC family transcriptional regulator [Paenibacillus sp. VTT E-133280]|nr:AraC family transcriptional regulator [Paenibacillus sp. VTT E-133280]